MIDAGREALPMELPEVEHGQYLLDYLSEIGEARHNGNILSPIDWQEIRAWAEVTGTRLSAWDTQILRRLSAVYVNQYHASEDPQCPPPWMPETENDKRITRNLDSLMKVAGAKND